jgi:hypothetical protein
MGKQNKTPWVYIKINLYEIPIDEIFLRDKQINPSEKYEIGYIKHDGEGESLFCSENDLPALIKSENISGEIFIRGPTKSTK